MFINWKLGELNLKIVYYGPALSGKTTNLEFIHARTNPALRGELVSIKTKQDRTLYFDFLQLEPGQIRGLRPKFNLYTVPGQVVEAASRELVLQGADGVVFVGPIPGPDACKRMWIRWPAWNRTCARWETILRAVR